MTDKTVTQFLFSPIRLAVVLQKFSPDVFAGVEPRDDRIHDARRVIQEGFMTRRFGLAYTSFSRIVCINETNQHCHG